MHGITAGGPALGVGNDPKTRNAQVIATIVGDQRNVVKQSRGGDPSVGAVNAPPCRLSRDPSPRPTFRRDPGWNGLPRILEGTRPGIATAAFPRQLAKSSA